MILITVGLIMLNPLGIFYNFAWLAPFFVSPLIIYYFSKATSASRTSISKVTTYTNGGYVMITCQLPQSHSVNQVLGSYKILSE
jgi:hypothetical protein